MITDVRGVRVGHWTDAVGRTGCTVILLPPRTVASGEVRGGAPGTREWALLDPARTVDAVDAVVLAGGSAFGLAAGDGVVEWCAAHDRGWPTPAGRVPIVVGLILYDLGVGDAAAHPGPTEGYEACAAATGGPYGLGAVGAGTGATIGKWRGPDASRPGGLGSATERAGPLIVSALVAVNALGDLRPTDGTPVPLSPWPSPPVLSPVLGPGQSTTIGLVVTNAGLTKTGARAVAGAAHDGLARAIEPVHLSADGDAFVAAATGAVTAPTDQVATLAARAMEAAVRAAPFAATSARSG